MPSRCQRRSRPRSRSPGWDSPSAAPWSLRKSAIYYSRMRLIISLLSAAVTAAASVALVSGASVTLVRGSMQRPPVMGRTAGVSAGHPLTTAAAVEILQQGGNAFDAGVAAMLVGGVVEQDLYGFGGEGLVLVYPRKDGKVTAVVGQGW